MRHRKDHRRLGRKSEHRRALLRNLVTALFQHERIETTVAKAKETRRFAERMITFGKQGDLAARRQVAAYIMKPEIVVKLFSTIAPWYKEREGGYTRIIRIGHRLGDAGETAYLELVKSVAQKEEERATRTAAAEAKALAQAGEKTARKQKQSDADAEADADTGSEARPKRGKKKEAAGVGGGGGAKPRRGPRKVGGG